MQKNATSHLKSKAIYIDGKNRTAEIESYNFNGEKCTVIYKNNGKSYSYNKSKIQIVKSTIQTKNAESIFSYLKEIAETVGLTTEEGGNTLAKSYERLSFIPENSILSHYLNQKQPERKEHPSPIEIFPFGFNLSQKDAVNEAFSNPLSVIEGPPGTGKTQTILNIIANAVMNDQSVAVVSSNNSATKNVFEKLEKNNISFIAALLGNSANKKEFVDSQTPIPDLSEWKLSHEETQTITESNSLLFAQLKEKLEFKNELALLNLELKNLETEHHHFSSTNALFVDLRFKKDVTSEQLLSLWITIENYEKSGKKLNWWRKLIFPFLYGVRDKNFYELPYQELIKLTQHKYYLTKISELTIRQQQLESELQNFSFESKMKAYTDASMQLFRNKLSQKYNGKERPEYTVGDLRFKSEDFISDYPVIMSTTYSLRNSLDEKVMYDFVIIDESSQVDLATGALALSCAKKAVIVGDLKQLPNVVDKNNTVKTDRIFDNYQLPEAYRYSNHSLLLSITELFADIPKTLLKEHYRCHPQIIDFCNRKFYNNQLIILSEAQSDRNPLIVYKTVAGNHARNLTNQRQIDVIIQDIIPNESLESTDLGIVTPYRKQTSALQNTFKGTKIKADTVDKFQGRENDVIILSTVDNEISDFTDNANRLNVAISRAKDQLILLVNGNESEKDNNISDLIRYIDYHNFDIVNSEINSIFDYLYKGYEEKLKEFLSNQKKKSIYDSENLMYFLIKEVLSLEEFSKYDVVLHFPLRNLISDYSKLSDEEEKYARHHATHLDFIVYNKLGKNPVLAIEVDGYEYHRAESRQGERDVMKNEILEKYNIPLLRFSTTGSGERERLMEKLVDL
ncbi:AAA domain-containing protein [Chryseobacterium sp. Ch-15]|uniref:AAA domain-containing protein n=1 Tax=Chryseobacterium muglaense TaxID=2893752 RepID=A0A9Q3YPL5_9FLAO|nr:AAA domain-containing protein [Chryseobacterium muglaense]MBD3906882.1 AAA family ATPase [Chryseobacterium muglaense]MCC9033036.1 AAA domain-containing protein [Chryseobacterium muglaense]MCM2556626.1 AAA domain-containing protein [Chryseobacterium muglaense]